MRNSKVKGFATTSQTVPVMIKILLNPRLRSSGEVWGQKGAVCPVAHIGLCYYDRAFAGVFRDV